MGTQKKRQVRLYRWEGGALRRTRDPAGADIMLLFSGGDEIQARGKYTAHDRYMGQPWSGDLSKLIDILKAHRIDYRSEGGGWSDALAVGDHNWLESAAVWFAAEGFAALRKHAIR